MEQRLNVVIALLAIMVVLMLVNMFVPMGSRLESSAKMKLDDCRIDPSEPGC